MTMIAIMNRNLSFDEAFNAARNAGYKLFEWHGKEYTTEMEEEMKKRLRVPPDRYIIREREKP